MRITDDTDPRFIEMDRQFVRLYINDREEILGPEAFAWGVSKVEPGSSHYPSVVLVIIVIILDNEWQEMGSRYFDGILRRQEARIRG